MHLLTQQIQDFFRNILFLMFDTKPTSPDSLMLKKHWCNDSIYCWSSLWRCLRHLSVLLFSIHYHYLFLSSCWECWQSLAGMIWRTSVMRWRESAPGEPCSRCGWTVQLKAGATEIVTHYSDVDHPRDHLASIIDLHHSLRCHHPLQRIWYCW